MRGTEINLEQTLFCGQCFRWRRLPDDRFEGVVGRTVARVFAREGDLWFEGVTRSEYERLLRPYFDLDTDYGVFARAIAAVPSLRPVVGYAGGIRVLRQDAWEALASFILSQNNNIARITGIVARLCERFGEPLERGWFAFPPPERLAACTVQDLAPLRCGFRARYLIDAAQRVASGEIDLEEARAVPCEEARGMLMRICGVGPKVADCALLYGLHRLECVPVDVWMGRAFRLLLPDGLPDGLRDCAGVAQQMMFHTIRTRPECLSPPIP